MAAQTREEWLVSMAAKVTEALFTPQGFTVPSNIRYTCGFPSKQATSRRNRRIGECWPLTASGDSTFEIMVSPIISDPVEAAAILIHEMVHAVVGLEHQHRRPFGRCARAVGLEGKMTATRPCAKLKDQLAEIVKEVGAYRHAELRAINSRVFAKQESATKLECLSCATEGKRYILRMGPASLRLGNPICPVHMEAMQIQG